MGHAFEREQRQSLEVGAHRRNVDAAQDRGQVGARAEEVHPVGHAELGRHSLECVPRRAVAGDHEPGRARSSGSRANALISTSSAFCGRSWATVPTTGVSATQPELAAQVSAPARPGVARSPWGS